MVFSSSIFVFFFLPIVLGLYFTSPRALKNSLLLFSSLLFYAWGEGPLVLVLLASTVFNYGLARLIENNRNSRTGYIILVVVVCANLSLLCYYKYTNFIFENFSALAAALGYTPFMINNILLPIGISFFTFQSISYVVDVYRGTAQSQRSFIDAALYISLFPQLIAGPIVRYHDVDKQLPERRIPLQLFSDGIRRFIIGLGKKVLIANPLSFPADQIFSIPANQLTWELSWLGILCYTLQIYFDFSGYSDMAIGLGKMFGFRFLENFNYPYTSTSIREFWRRWHISLSTWFRDYLYVPLGGNQIGQLRLYLNLVVVFLLCGLWHGANWTFIIWGLYHGFFLVAERIGLDRIINRLWRPFQHLYCLIIVIMGWVFFRSNDVSHAYAFLGAMFGINHSDGVIYPIKMYLTSEVALTLLAGVIGSTKSFTSTMRLFLSNILIDDRSLFVQTGESGRIEILQSVCILLLFILISAYLSSGTYNPFIYFRF